MSRQKTGRPPRLSSDTIAAAAETIIDTDGIEALSMRRLARALGSSPTAVYRHVRGKDELLLLLLDRAARELRKGPLPRDPRKRIFGLFQIVYDGLAMRPWVVGVLVKGDLIAPSFLWFIEEIVAAFVAAGLSPQRAGAAYLVAWRYTVGHLIVRYETGQNGAKLKHTPGVLRQLSSIDTQQFPILAELTGFWPAARKRDTYREDLAALIDGLLARG